MAGRIKMALANRLAGLGVEIEADDLQTTERACRDIGGASWGGYGHVGNRRVWVYSFASMTECLRRKDLTACTDTDLVEVL